MLYKRGHTTCDFMFSIFQFVYVAHQSQDLTPTSSRSPPLTFFCRKDKCLLPTYENTCICIIYLFIHSWAHSFNEYLSISYVPIMWRIRRIFLFFFKVFEKELEHGGGGWRREKQAPR